MGPLLSVNQYIYLSRRLFYTLPKCCRNEPGNSSLRGSSGRSTRFALLVCLSRCVPRFTTALSLIRGSATGKCEEAQLYPPSRSPEWWWWRNFGAWALRYEKITQGSKHPGCIMRCHKYLPILSVMILIWRGTHRARGREGNPPPNFFSSSLSLSSIHFFYCIVWVGFYIESPQPIFSFYFFQFLPCDVTFNGHVEGHDLEKE